MSINKEVADKIAQRVVDFVGAGGAAQDITPEAIEAWIDEALQPYITTHLAGLSAADRRTLGFKDRVVEKGA